MFVYVLSSQVEFGDQEVFGFSQNSEEKDWVYNFKEKIGKWVVS